MKTQIELYSNIVRHLSLMAIAACGCAVAPPILAQSDLPPPPPGMVEYYSALARSGSGSPGGVHAEEDSGPPGPGGGLSGAGGGNYVLPDYGTNLYLTIALASNQQTATVTLVNTISNVNYLLLATSALDGLWVTNQSLLATSTVTVAAPFWTSDSSGLFFMAKEGAPPAPGSVKWIAPLSTSGFDKLGTGLDASPAIDSPTGQIAITIANAGSPTNTILFSVDPISGDVRWMTNIFNLALTNTVTFQTAEFAGSATIASDGTIYAGSIDGNLYSLYPDGSTNWVRAAGFLDSIYSTPAIGSNGLIYVTSDEAEVSHGEGNDVTGVTAFNTNGSTNAFFRPQDLFYGNGGDVDGNPIVGADGSIYFLAEGCRLYALTADLQLKWFLPLPGDTEPASTPALAPDGSIVVGSSSPYLYDVNPDGSLNWVLNLGTLGGGAVIQCAPTIDQNGVIYTGSSNATNNHIGLIFAVNPDGNVKWIFTNNFDPTTASPAVASDGTVYAGAADFTLYALTTNGSVAWSFFTGGPIYGSPAILPDGSVLIASEDGNLYCLWGTAPLQTNASWPMYQQSPGHNAQQPPTDFTNTVPYCGAPFVFNGFYTGDEFGFSMTGAPGSSNWNVYASTNLAETNWTQLATNLTMNATNGNNNFTESDVSEYSQRFYKVSRSNCCSQAIGFVNLTVLPGTNLIANQFYQVDENILNVESGGGVTVSPMNTLNTLFTISNAWTSAQAGTIISKWNGNGFVSDTNANVGRPTWIDGGEMTLLPGNGVLINNAAGTSFTTTFVGLIREQQIFQIAQGTNHLIPTTNYLSATIPEAGDITTITGYVPSAGDTIRLWNTTSNEFVSYPYTSDGWTNGTPSVGVGEGFVLVTTNAYTWTNTWEVCPSP